MKKYLLLIISLIGGIIIGLLFNTINYNLFVLNIVYSLDYTLYTYGNIFLYSV